jgi:hypothetical protein
LLFAGAWGGVVNALLTDNRFPLPGKESGVLCPGAITNILVGAFAALSSWSFYGSGASVELAEGYTYSYEFMRSGETSGGRGHLRGKVLSLDVAFMTSDHTALAVAAKPKLWRLWFASPSAYRPEPHPPITSSLGMEAPTFSAKVWKPFNRPLP